MGTEKPIEEYLCCKWTLSTIMTTITYVLFLRRYIGTYNQKNTNYVSTVSMQYIGKAAKDIVDSIASGLYNSISVF